MPGEDGISIARRLRAAGSTSIIMLTACDDVIDRIVGLEVGADDYLTKPFDLRELARAHASGAAPFRIGISGCIAPLVGGWRPAITVSPSAG
jgi:CheY-like chemotaxis protein